MISRSAGVHHVTAIAGDPQRNLDFYEGILGLRLVKKTVNFDDPGTYHLYYGDEIGHPGTIMTFFPWADAPRGRIGAGQLTVTSFSVPRESLGYWTERLVKNGVRFEKPQGRFGETVLTFEDPDGLRVELVAADDGREGWSDGPVPTERSVRDFHHVTLATENPERTAGLMADVLGFRHVGEAEGRSRYAANDGVPGSLVDISDGTGFPRGSMGVGTVHHVAFRAKDDEEQLEMREEVAALGYDPTPVIDRQYFHSVYFREPGGVLFEIATDPPGFTFDEAKEQLGTELKLPPQYEFYRERLEQTLPPLSLPRVTGETRR
jgi:glyoxalase family protein